jgi:hypothetical protein
MVCFFVYISTVTVQDLLTLSSVKRYDPHNSCCDEARHYHFLSLCLRFFLHQLLVRLPYTQRSSYLRLHQSLHDGEGPTTVQFKSNCKKETIIQS